MDKTLTAHELARHLLEGPDLPIYRTDEGEPLEITEGDVTKQCWVYRFAEPHWATLGSAATLEEIEAHDPKDHWRAAPGTAHEALLL